MNTFWTILGIIAGIVLLFFLVFLLVRLGSSAYYRSKKEFLVWYHKQPNYRREEGD